MSFPQIQHWTSYLLSGSAFLNTYADSPLSCSIASTPSGKFQSIPLSIKVQDAVEFGKYLKFLLQYERKIVTESVKLFIVCGFIVLHHSLCAVFFHFFVLFLIFSLFQKRIYKKVWLPGRFQETCRTRNRKISLCGLSKSDCQICSTYLCLLRVVCNIMEAAHNIP